MQTSDVSLISSQQFAALALPDLTPETVQDLSQPPAPDIVDTAPEVPPPAPASETNPALPEATPDSPPKPAPSPRIAPTPAPPPPPDAEISEQVTPEVAPDTGGEEIAEPTPATAPEEAANEIVTEAEQPAAAPKVSRVPLARPSRPVQPTEPASVSDPVANAVAEAIASENPAPTRPIGPPLTGSEKDALRVAVQSCWNVGSLSSEALQTTVVVAVTLQRSGKPDNASIRMLSFEGGSQTSADQAFGAARRAIIRCGGSGFDLPVEKYSQWREIEMTFNPERMRIK